MTGAPAHAYRPGHGRHDVAVDAAGTPRPGWDRLLADIDRLGPDEVDRRQRAADRLMQAESASLRIHGGPGVPGPERVAASPYVVAAADWDRVAQGLAERAELLVAISRDLAGPRELLRAGVVPVEAVAAHPAFLPGARRERPAELVTVGADVVVDAAGCFRVRGQFGDVARGDGQALLARSVVARVLPESAAESLPVADHDGWFRALRTRLAGLAPAGRSSPRTVVLAGSPEAAGYVEDAFLAIHLGYHLAEPADLVVREGRVWLRSLDGAERVDVVLRRIPEAGLDPVEDPNRSFEGVPGLIQTQRDGGVALANPYGAGLAALPTLEPFLSAAARALLGRDLRLPGIPALWLGDPDHRAEVLAAPERFVFRDAEAAESPVTAGALLGEAELADLRARITARPERWVAQVDTPLATTPCWHDGVLQPRPVALRTQVLVDGERTRVLPGGHGRVLDPVAPLVDEPGPGTSPLGMDVWVLGARRPTAVLDPGSRVGARDPAPRTDASPTVAPAATRPAGPVIPQVDLRRSLPTRAAEAMFWMGRSVERAEMAARAVLVYLTDVVGADLDAGVARSLAGGLRAVSGGVGHPLPSGDTGPDMEAEIRAALAGWPTAVVASLRSTTANARRARQLLSSRTWRVLAMLDAEAAALTKLAGSRDEPGLAAFDATEVLDRVLVPLAALSGLTGEGMVRGPAWRFLDVGRRLERALLVLGLVESTFDAPAGTAVDDLRLEVTLAACESLVAYRRSFRSDVTVEAVGDLLLGDPDNPRSVRFQLDRLTVDLLELPDRPMRHRQLGEVRAAQVALARQLPLGSGPPDPDGLGAAAGLVVAVRPHLLAIGEDMGRGWFGDSWGSTPR